MSDAESRSGRERIVRHFMIAFALAAILYVLTFYGVEHLRTRKGGWQVSFTSDSAGTPTVVVSQPRLGISAVSFEFPGERVDVGQNAILVVFDRPVTNVPFGRVIYLDTTFLPGAIVLNVFGHEIQLLPRVLMVDRREIPWQNRATFRFDGTNTVASTKGK